MGIERSGDMRTTGLAVIAGMLVIVLAGCAMVPPQSFLDPTKVGMFPLDYREGGIRRVLTPRDGPIALANATDPTPEDLVPVYEDYRIGPLDGVQIFINDFYQAGFPYSANIEVSATGYISIPQLGLIKVQGMTAQELEQDLRTRIEEAGILPDPIIQVVVTNRRYQYFNVIGSVARAGAYPLTQPDTRLLDVLGMVGDIGPEAKRLYVIRRMDTGSGGERTPDREQPAPEEEELIIPPPDEGALGSTLYVQTGDGSAQAPSKKTTASATRDEFEDVLAPGGERAAGTAQPGRKMAPLIYDPTTGKLKEAPARGPVAGNEGRRPAATAPEGGAVARGGDDEEPFDWEAIPEYELSQRVIEIDVDALKSGDPRYNIVVRNRDLINIPVDTGVYYMMGEVNRPGVYAFNSREITIKQAIATVGGFSQMAWPSRCEIIRREKGTDKQITIPVNLDRIFAGLDDDILLRDQDIVNVGTDIVAPFLFVIRNSFRFAYGFGFVYDRNFADKDAYGAKINPQTLDIQRRQSRGLPF